MSFYTPVPQPPNPNNELFKQYSHIIMKHNDDDDEIINPCTNNEEKDRFKEIVTRKVINRVKTNRKRYKSPLETAKHFIDIHHILQKRQKSSIDETVEIFGRKVRVKRNGNNICNQIDFALKEKKERVDQVKNIAYCMNQENWNKIRDNFDHQSYCKKNGIKLECDDQYFYWNEPNDFKLIQRIKQSKTAPISNLYNSSSSKLNELFINILTENGDGPMTELSNYRFLKNKFPASKCIDCAHKLIVIPLCYIGDGDIDDIKNEKESVGIYKISAICSNYPKCKFPLYRSTYSKYWIRSAWFHDKYQIKKTNKKRKLDDIHNNNNNNIKRRKLVNNNNNNNDRERGDTNLNRLHRNRNNRNKESDSSSSSSSAISISSQSTSKASITRNILLK